MRAKAEADAKAKAEAEAKESPAVTTKDDVRRGAAPAKAGGADDYGAEANKIFALAREAED